MAYARKLLLGDTGYSGGSLRGWLLFERFGVSDALSGAACDAGKITQRLPQIAPTRAVPPRPGGMPMARWFGTHWQSPKTWPAFTQMPAGHRRVRFAARIAGVCLPVGVEAAGSVAMYRADSAFRRWRAAGLAQGTTLTH